MNKSYVVNLETRQKNPVKYRKKEMNRERNCFYFRCWLWLCFKCEKPGAYQPKTHTCAFRNNECARIKEYIFEYSFSFRQQRQHSIEHLRRALVKAKKTIRNSFFNNNFAVFYYYYFYFSVFLCHAVLLYVGFNTRKKEKCTANQPKVNDMHTQNSGHKNPQWRGRTRK